MVSFRYATHSIHHHMFRFLGFSYHATHSISIKQYGLVGGFYLSNGVEGKGTVETKCVGGKGDQGIKEQEGFYLGLILFVIELLDIEQIERHTHALSYYGGRRHSRIERTAQNIPVPWASGYFFFSVAITRSEWNAVESCGSCYICDGSSADSSKRKERRREQASVTYLLVYDVSARDQNDFTSLDIFPLTALVQNEQPEQTRINTSRVANNERTRCLNKPEQQSTKWRVKLHELATVSVQCNYMYLSIRPGLWRLLHPSDNHR